MQGIFLQKIAIFLKLCYNDFIKDEISDINS